MTFYFSPTPPPTWDLELIFRQTEKWASSEKSDRSRARERDLCLRTDQHGYPSDDDIMITFKVSGLFTNKQLAEASPRLKMAMFLCLIL